MRTPDYGKPPYLEVSYTAPPTASFTPSGAITDHPDYLVNFTDTSTGGNLTTWNWSFRNVTPGNGTLVKFATVQNPTTIFTEGNWAINLTVTNALGSSTSNDFWLNLSKCNGGSLCSLRKYVTNTTDGYLLRAIANDTFSDLIDGLGTGETTSSADGYTFVRAGVATDTYQLNTRTVFIFNASEIPDWATITSAKFRASSYYTYAVLTPTTDIGLVKFVGSSIERTYYNSFDRNWLTDTVTVNATFPARYAAQDWTLNTIGIRNISLVGETKLMALTNWDYQKTAPPPPWAYGYAGINFNAANSVKYPAYLEMEYNTTLTLPSAAFTTCPTTPATDYPDLKLVFADLSTGIDGTTTYKWNFTNVSGNNTPVTFSTTKNPSYVFPEGNWKIELTVSNALGSNTSQPAWANLTECTSGGLVCNHRFFPPTDNNRYPLRVLSATGSGETFSSIMTGVGTTNDNSFAVYSPYLRASSTSNQFNASYRWPITINSYDLPDNANITNARMILFKNAYGSQLGPPNVTITDGTIGTPNYPQTSDYQRNGTVELVGRLAYSGVQPTLYPTLFNFTETGKAYINKTGYTVLFVRNPDDVDSTFRGTWTSGGISYLRWYSPSAGGDYGMGQTVNPKFEVSYTLPLMGISNLTNDTSVCEAIRWTWNNPTGLQNITISQNGTVLHIVDNTTTFDNWTDLAWNTNYTFSATVCGMDGTCNMTPVNLTSPVNSCGGPPVASFTSNRTLVCGRNGTVQFNDTSLNVPTAWNWSFGDGNYSINQSPAFTYNWTGVFTVNLSISNKYGSNSTSRVNYIIVSEECPSQTCQTVIVNDRYPVQTSVVLGAVAVAILLCVYAYGRKRNV